MLMAVVPGWLHGRRGRARLALAAALLLALPSVAWIAAPLSWRLDLVGNLSAHILPVVATAAAMWTLCRHWAAAMVSWAAVGVLLWPLASGRAPREEDDDAAISVLVYNAMVGTRPASEQVRLVQESGADLVVLLEPPDEVLRACGPDGILRRTYPHAVRRPWASNPPNSYQVLISRWALARPDGAPFEGPVVGVMAAVADAPCGRLAVVVVHPNSPRNRERWRQALAEAGRAAALARELSDAGLPVLVMGDLNSTPSGLVSRRICSLAGLRRCKPWLAPAGTYPSDREWPLRIAIDDVLVSAGMAVCSWEVMSASGSDHAPVRVSISVPGTPASRYTSLPGGPDPRGAPR